MSWYAGRVRRALLLALALVSCIERPWEAGPARARTDPGTVRDLLLSALPAEMTPVDAVFGGSAELAGYVVQPARLVSGERATVTLVWRCKAEMDAWRIFVHLDASDSSGQRIHAEHDPAQGRYPTDAWRPGDLVADTFSFVPGRTPLLLYLGFYTQGENRLRLDSPGRGRDDGNNRLLAGVLPLAQ
jgi:hypothetical protein